MIMIGLIQLRIFKKNYNRYTGTLIGDYEIIENCGELPMNILIQPKPVKWFESIYLYEDELCDNGTASLTVKIVFYLY